jgi:multidrug efflux system membrane fusion protein
MKHIPASVSVPVSIGRAKAWRTRSRKRQAGVAKPVVAAVIVAVLAAGGWWLWSSHGAAGGEPAGGASAPAGGASRAGGGGFGGGGPGGGGRFGGANRIQPVSVGTVRRQDVRVTVSAIGSITSANMAVVRAKVSGELKAIYFKEGQTVKAGTVLAEIDPQPFRIALAQAQGTLARDQAQLANAKLDLVRYKDLIAKDAAPKQQLDTQAALVQQLEGTVLSDQAQVDNAKLQLSYTRIVAPISGLAGLKQVDVGNNVQPSDSNGLLSIAQTRPVNVVFSVPDVQLPQILKQIKAARPMPVEAWDRDQKTKLADGKLASTDNAIDSATGTIKLKAQFPNANDELFPNQFVNVRLQVDDLADTLAVPSAAVLRGTQGTYVYLVNADKTVTVRRVRAGANDGDWVAIQADLKPGDKVVTDGADRLREGAQVEVVVPLAPAGGPGGFGGGGRRRDGASAPAGGASGGSGGGGSGRSAGSPPPAGADSGPGAGQGRPGGPAGEARPAAPGGRPADGPPPRGDGPRPQRGEGPPPAASAGGGDLPPWFSRLPPEMQEKFKAMSPEERAAWIQKRREERQQQQGNN